MGYAITPRRRYSRVYQNRHQMTMIPNYLLDQKTSFPWLRAYFLGMVSDTIYFEAEERRKRWNALGLEEVYFDHGKKSRGFPTDTEVAIVSNPELIIITFRGSESEIPPVQNIVDWLNDFTIIKTNYLDTRVHLGFVLALKAVWSGLADWLGKNRGQRKVWLTGHSLGGALAQLAGYSLQKPGNPFQE